MKARVRTYTDGVLSHGTDHLAVEEPLEVRVAGRMVNTTMRTPGHDFELVAGWLLSEGVISERDDLPQMEFCTDLEQHYNTINALLRPGLVAQPRLVPTTAACGICGKVSIDELAARIAPLPDGPLVDAATVLSLPDKLRAQQRIFESTGGLHASGLFTADGQLVAVREDVGRHNALDKLLGWAFLESRLPLSGHIVMLSGRASFELVQKALVAGAPIICAVSAPSSLAVDLAQRYGATLVGFLRGERFTVYAGSERIGSSDHVQAREES